MSTNESSAAVDELAAQPLDATDELLLRQVGALYDFSDPVPPGLVERLQFGVTLDALEAEIAKLQRVDELAGARSDDATEVQTVTFTSASLTTMITVTPAGVDRVRIDGWAAPGGGLLVELRIVGDRLQTTADADGRFVFDDVPRGMAQFLLRAASATSGGGTEGHPPVITPSMEI